MKNSKKFLVVIALIAVFVTTVVTIAIANTAYSGTLEGAATRLAAVDEAVEVKNDEGEVTVTLLQAKTEAIKTLYKYLKTVDPATDGYDELKAKCDAKFAEVGRLYIDLILNADKYVNEKAEAVTRAQAKSEALESAYGYLALGDSASAAYAELKAEYDAKFVQIASIFVNEINRTAIGEDANGNGIPLYKFRSSLDENVLGASDVDKRIKSANNVLNAFYAHLALVDSATPGYSDAKSQYDSFSVEIGRLYFQLVDLYGTVDEKVTALNTVYTYIETMDSATDGYAELKSDCDAKRIALGNEYLDKVDSADDESLKSDALDTAYTYIKKLDTALSGYEELKARLDKLCVSVADSHLSLIAKLTDVIEKIDALSVASKNISRVEDAATEGLDALKTAYSEECLEVADSSLQEFFGSGDTTYYTVVEAMALVQMIESVPELSYKISESKLYTGKISDVQAKISLLDKNDSFEDVKKGLAGIYTYLVKTPVNPTTDAYYDFIVRYYELCDVLVQKFEASVDNEETESGKLAALEAMREYLKATPISSSVVAAYNEKVKDTADVYAGIKDAVSGITKLESLVVTPLVSDLTELSAKVSAIENAADNDSKISALKEAFKYLAENEIDSSAEGFQSVFGKYVALRDGCVKEFSDAIDGETNLKGKFEKLAAMYDFLSSCPISETAIKTYNEKREAVVKECNDFISLIESAKNIEYKESASTAVTATVEELVDMLADITAAQNEYQSADADAKAEALTEWKDAVAKTHRYIMAVNLPVGESGYDTFVSGYNAAKAALMQELLAKVDSAADDTAKKAALAEIKAYLETCPLSRLMIEAYNAKVAELFVSNEEEAAAMKMSCIYFETDAAFEALEEAENIETKYSVFKQIYSYYQRKHDVTDAAYTDFKTKYETACVQMQSAIIATFETDDTQALQDAICAACEFLKSAPISKTAVENVASAIDEILEEYRGYADGAIQVESKYSEISKYISSFNEALTLEEQLEAFKNLYNKVAEYDSKYFTSTEAEAYSLFKSEYESVCGKMISVLEALNYLDALSKQQVLLSEEAVGENPAFSLRTYLKEVPFSQKAIDGYNTKLQEFQQIDFAAVADGFTGKCPEMTYTSPSGFLSSLSTLQTLLESAKDTKEALKAAYDHMMGFEKENPITRVYDFGVDGYCEAILLFNEAKAEITTQLEKSVTTAKDAEQKKEALAAMRKYLAENCMSLSMVDAFNASRTQVLSTYASAFKGNFDSLFSMIDALKNQIEAHPIEVSRLSEESKALYNKIYAELSSMQQAFEYLKIEGYVVNFYNATGDFALITQNTAIDKLNYYFKKEDSLDPAYSYSNTFDYLVGKAFASILDDIDAMEAEAKASAVTAMESYLTEKKVPAKLVEVFNQRYEKQVAAVSADASTEAGTREQISALMREFKGKTSYEDKLSAFAAIINYLNTKPLSTASIYRDLVETVNKAKEALEVLVEERKAFLDSQVSFEEYSLGYVEDTSSQASLDYINYDFENTGPYRTLTTPNSTSKIERKQDSETGNWYIEIYTGETKNPYFNIYLENNEDSVVFEFDIMSNEELNFKTMTPTFYHSNTGVKTTDNRIFQFLNNKFYDNNLKVVEGIEAVPGEWMHLTIVFNAETNRKSVYIDYVHVYTEDFLKVTDKSGSMYCTTIRMWANLADVSYCYDNLRVYNGTSFRIVDKFDRMSNEEKVEYYLDIAADPEQDSVSRLRAYNELNSLMNVIEITDIQREVYDSIDYEESVLPGAREDFYQYIKAEIERLKGAELTTGTVSNVKDSLEELLEYFNTNSKYMDQASDKFLENRSGILEIQADVERTEALSNLVAALKRFHRATSAASMQKHYAEAVSYYNKCAFEVGDNYATAMEDSLVTEFLKEIAKADLADYYNVYAPNRINAQLYFENSKRIVECVAFIKQLVVDGDTLEEQAYLDALKVAALDNFDSVNVYINVIRGIVKEQTYDPDYNGVEEAIEIFKFLDEDFYTMLREEQYAVIKAKFDRYASTTSYIERYGICLFVQNYIEENDVDMNTEAGAQYLLTLSAYFRELEIYKEDYVKILEANTEAFIKTVDKMTAYVSYSELKPLYDKALNEYYYNMNVDAEETQAAIALFKYYNKLLTDMEYNSQMFVDSAKTLKTASRMSHIYRALVNCGKYYDGIDEGVDGVSEALEIYKTKLAEYNSKTAAVNQDISVTADVVCSVRTNSITGTILAVIKSIFSK